MNFRDLTDEQRSALMARVRKTDTRPELVVRRLVFALGFRYRLHRRELPGTPDLAFLGRRKAIFVNGCFWHGHAGCRLNRVPRARPDYWLPKLERNKRRDQRVRRALRRQGWKVLTIWECETRAPQPLMQRLQKFIRD